MINTSAIIRQRYQLTLPRSLRNAFDWLAPNKAIQIKAISKKELIIRPYQEEKINWKEIWRSLEKVQNMGAKFSSTDFLVKDRESR